MAARKRRLHWIVLGGTGLNNEKILISAHEILPFPASTYHKLTYPNGMIQYKNDFGVSSVTLIPVDMSDDEITQAGY